MNKKMYEVNWHHVNDKFSHCTVTPITVLREGVLPGCSGVTITAIDHTGRKFQGSPDNYYVSEEIAWDEIKRTIAEAIDGYKKQMMQLAEEVATMQRYLVKDGSYTPDDVEQMCERFTQKLREKRAEVLVKMQ